MPMFGVGGFGGRLQKQGCRRRAAPDVVARDPRAAIALNELSEGEWARVVELAHGCCAYSRLTGLGIHKGALLRVLRSNCRGKGNPLLVEVEGTLLGLGGGLGSHVIVEPIEGKSGLTEEQAAGRADLLEVEASNVCGFVVEGMNAV